MKIVSRGAQRPRGRTRPSRLAALSLAVALLASCFATGAHRSRRPIGHHGGARGSFAFHYAPVLTDEALDWYSRFNVLITHDPLPRTQVDRLHAAGTKVLLYEWSVAFYETRATAWQRSLLSQKNALLNEAPLRGGTGSNDSGAWYFDPDSSEHEFDRASHVAQRVESAGYDGVFFDATTFESVHPRAREEYERRHHATTYDAAFSRFLVQLRRRLPNAIVFTNQAYRSAANYLPYVDWDMTESLITSDGAVRSWNDRSDPWNSVQFVMTRMIEPVARRYPHVRFAHLNYAGSPETIRFVVATAQLFGGDGYVAASSHADEADAIYFRERGRALSPRVDRADGSWQFFDNGLIVISGGTAMTIPNVAMTPLRDRFTGKVYCGASVEIVPTNEPQARFFDVTGARDCAPVKFADWSVRRGPNPRP